MPDASRPRRGAACHCTTSRQKQRVNAGTARTRAAVADNGCMSEPSEAREYSDEQFSGLARGELVARGVTFLNCTFSDSDLMETDFNGAHLVECRFVGCELALSDFTDAVFQEVVFENCRLTGINFSLLQQGALGVHAKFRDCDLSFASFRGMDLTTCSFTGCVFNEAEFQRCNLTKVSFDDCDFSRCTFSANNLKEADLRTARNYVISAEGNQVRGMKVSLPEAVSLLSALGIDVD